MALVLSQSTVFSEFNSLPIPPVIAAATSCHVSGGQAELHRYSQPSEKEGISLGSYNPLANTSYPWPSQSPGSIVDLSFVQLYIDNAYLQYFYNPSSGADTIAPVPSYQNQIKSAATNWVANGTLYPRAAALYDRNVEVGDWVLVTGGGASVWSSIANILPTQLPGSVSSAVPASTNQASQSLTVTTTQIAGSDNYIDLSSSASLYDGSATGDINETYTITVTQASVGGDATTALLNVASASGRDNQASVKPLAFGTAFAIGTRGLRCTFTNTNTGNTLTPGASPNNFIVGQVWTVAIQEAWTAPIATAGGTYTGTVNQQYICTVTRGGLYQNQQPITAPTVVPTINATGGGSTGGLLQAGTYFLKYTWVNSNGESTPSPESTVFSVSAGNIPQVTLPALPTGVTSISLYVTPTNGLAGTEIQYATGITTLTYNLASAVSTEPPASNTAYGVLTAPVSAAVVNPTGGGASGGALQAGTFYLKYTYTNSAGETAPSPESLQFTVAAGNQPLVTLPALPSGATGISLYITPPGGASGSEVVQYATGINSTSYTMASATSKLPNSSNTTSPTVTSPATTPTVTATGGGTTGGSLPAGTYYLKYSYTGTAGETLPSPESAAFTIAAGNIPQVTNLPSSAPTNAIDFRLYLTPVGAGTGTEVFYYQSTGSWAATYNMSAAFPTTAVTVPVSNTTNPVISAPSAAATVVATGGGASGGLLPPGTYYLKYSYSGKGGETTPSPESLVFTVAAGNIPQVTLPALPTNSTAINLYLTQPSGGSNTEILYAQGVTTTTYNLSLPMPIHRAPPGPNTSATFTITNPSVAPTANATGGGAIGGNLSAGSYYLKYSWVGDVNGETLPSSEISFSIAAGNIPAITVPTLPNGVAGANIYISQPGGNSGSETKFPSTNVSAGPTINLNATATSALINPPPATNTCTSLQANPSPPQITAVANSSTGGSSAGPVSVTAAASNVAVGTNGVLIQFSGSGLDKGDVYTIQASAPSAGPYRTLVLNNNLPSAIQNSSSLAVTLFLKEDLQIPQQSLASPPNLNWSATENLFTINAGILAYSPTLTNNGVPFAVPVVSGTDTDCYANYRAWLTTYANSISSLQVTSGGPNGFTASDLATITAALGTIDPDNPLCFGVYEALNNSNSQPVYFSATGDPTVTANWENILAMLIGNKNIRQLVPLTTNSAVLSLYQQHIDTQSASTVSGEWRFGLFALSAITTIPIVTMATSSNMEVVSAVINQNPAVVGTAYTYLTDTTLNAHFVTNGVLPGDTVRTLYTQDAFGNVTFSSFTVASVVNEDTLILVAGPASAVTTTQRTEVWRNLSPDQIAENLAAQIVATNDARIAWVWPDQINVNGVTVPGYFLCAGLGGFMSGIAPHQGIRFVGISGFDAPVLRSTVFFSQAQLNILAAAGAIIVTSDSLGDVYPMLATTSAQAAPLSMSLEQIVRTLDAVSYLTYSMMSSYFGNANVTSGTLASMKTDVQAAINLAISGTLITRIGSMINSGTIVTLAQSPTILNSTTLSLSVTYNYPDDNAMVTLVF
jgi:hypothetical protein